MTEFNPTSLPEGLTGLEAVNQPVFGVTKQVLNRLEKGYTPGQEVNAQIFKAGEGPHSLKDKLKEDLLALSSEGSDKVNFQVQWLTVLTAFQQLGASRARGEGKNNQGSDKSRFAVRMLQTYLIESTDPAFQVESVASDQQRHKSLVAVAEFGLALGALDEKQGKTITEHKLVSGDISKLLDRAIRAKENILYQLSVDSEKPQDKRRFETRNI